MRYDPDRHHRRSIRLRSYDYAQAGAYFFTVCTHNRQSLFGDVIEGEMDLSAHGRTVTECWDDLPNHYPGVELDVFVVMPNHVHGIIVLRDSDHDVGAGLKPALPNHRSARHELSEIVRGLKTFRPVV